MLAALLLALAVTAAEPKTVTAVAYAGKECTRCQLDLYLPAGGTGFPTLLWLHGGGITEGSKDDAFTVELARALARDGLAVAAVNYRLSPGAKFPAYVDDVAAATAWLRANVRKHGGDPARVFVGGHSAGGYLALMVAMDPRFLAR